MKSLGEKSLCFKWLKLRIAEFALIEQRIKDYLAKVGVNYDALDDLERLSTLIGAKLAIDNAVFNCVMVNAESHDADLPGQFEAFLKTVVPMRDYYETLVWIEDHTHDDSSEKIEKRFIEEGGYPRHEAYLRVLSMVVAGYISSEMESEKVDSVCEGLYCCYLHAKHDYFQGERGE